MSTQPPPAATTDRCGDSSCGLARASIVHYPKAHDFPHIDGHDFVERPSLTLHAIGTPDEGPYLDDLAARIDAAAAKRPPFGAELERAYGADASLGPDPVRTAPFRRSPWNTTADLVAAGQLDADPTPPARVREEEPQTWLDNDEGPSQEELDAIKLAEAETATQGPERDEEHPDRALGFIDEPGELLPMPECKPGQEDTCLGGAHCDSPRCGGRRIEHCARCGHGLVPSTSGYVRADTRTSTCGPDKRSHYPASMPWLTPMDERDDGEAKRTALEELLVQHQEDVRTLADQTATPRHLIERPIDMDDDEWKAFSEGAGFDPEPGPRKVDGAKLSIPKRWTFKTANVADNFDQHVREQLPWYDLATSGMAQVVRHYLPEKGVVVDLGASTGNVARALAADLVARDATLLAVDESQAMVDAYAAPGSPVLATIQDFVESGEEADVVVAFLSLMFVSPSHLERVVDQVMHYVVRPGGAFVVVDRMAPDEGYAGMVKSRLTLAGKLSAGATEAEIVAKELSLAGVQRPMPVDLLPSCGAVVEWFRFADFVGVLIERPVVAL